MSTEHSNTPITHEELTRKMNSAVLEGNMEEVDRLMAVEIAEPEVEEEPVEGVVEEVKEETPEATDVTKDETSTEGEVETKDEAATDSAASTPEDKTELNELDQLKQELHRLKSDAGRVPYMQRRQQELERELRDLKLSHKPAAKASAETDTATAGELPAALKDRIAKLREIDPDLADTLEVGFKVNAEAADKAKAAAAEQVKEYASTQDAREDEIFIQQQYTELVKEVPYAPQVFASKEWKEWKKSLTPGRLALAESGYADEVKIAINAFVHDMQTRFGGAEKEKPAAQSETPVASEAVTKVQESRERKLAAVVDTKAPAAKGTKPAMNEQELFSSYFNQIRKDNNFG